jgi:hypothetical protein
VQSQVGVALAAAFQVADARVGLAGDRFAPHVGGADGQLQARGQRAVGVQRRPVAVAATGTLRGRAFGHRTQAPTLAARRPRDHVDHATQRLGAVQHRHRAADDLDALDVVDRDPVVLVVAVADHAVAGTDALAVDQHQRVAAVHAAQVDRLAAADRPALDGDARFAAHGVEQVVGAARLDLLARDDVDRRGRVDQRHRMAGGGHDDGLQRRVGHGALRSQRQRQQEHRQGQGAAARHGHLRQGDWFDDTEHAQLACPRP